ncbi:MAG: amidohydrolase [Myxococcota bacterium]
MDRARVYVAARIHTLNPAKPVAEAVAVRSGRVVAVGTRDEALAAVDDAEVVELPGAVLIPGLVDAHAHLASLGRALSIARFEETRSAAEVVERLGTAGPESYQGEWLVGRGWDQNDWPGQAFPHRQLLDEKFPTTPVFLTRVDGHAVWVNSEALRRAGIDRTTKDPAGGRILRDERGEPTGVLVDNAIDQVSVKVPEPTTVQRQKRLKAALERCAEVGLTAVHDAGMDLATFTLLQQWDALGALPVRVYAMADGQGPDATLFLERGTFQGRHLTMRAVKFFADGALGSRGAALQGPYSDEPGQRGLLLVAPAELETRARRFAEEGFQVAVHAIGDRANHVALDVLERLEHARPGSRHRVEHAQVLAFSDVPRFSAAGIIASMQPTHATSDMPWAESRLGSERLRGAYAWRTLLDSGAKLAFGSDFPVEDPRPLLGLYAARTRQDAGGKPAGGWQAQERLSGEQALEAFTTGAAYASFAEERRGVLKAGMDADFVALAVDPVNGEAKALLSAKVLLTVVDGREVYRP